jgi:hypothetical protein
MDLLQPIIKRDNTYVMALRKLSVHSEDRDIQKWKKSNHFAIDIPSNITNVTSIVLTSAAFPSNQKVISKINENTILRVKVGSNTETITIDEGTYEPIQLANELKFKMENAGLIGFDVLYNEVQQRFVFTNNAVPFTFVFSDRDPYDVSCGDTSPIYENHSKWGLGYNLGFNNKRDYDSKVITDDLNFGYLDAASNPVVTMGSGGNVNVLYADVNPRLIVDSCIYMEMKHYNQYDEMIPYAETTTLTNCNSKSNIYKRNNGIRGTMNSAFAKINMSSNPLSIIHK